MPKLPHVDCKSGKCLACLASITEITKLAKQATQETVQLDVFDESFVLTLGVGIAEEISSRLLQMSRALQPGSSVRLKIRHTRDGGVEAELSYNGRLKA